jgi:RNA polymerase sigma-70 factor (ECF subfamily)
MTEIPDKTLVQQALEGKTESFAQLCTRYYPALIAVAHAILLDHHTAEDAAQETLAVAVRQLRGLKKPERFGVWLTAICRNVTKDILSKRLRQRRVKQAACTCISPDKGDDQHVLLDQAIEQLPLRLREVLMLRYFNEMTYQQMSSVLGLSEQAINGRLRRARKKIAAYMKARGFSG